MQVYNSFQVFIIAGILSIIVVLAGLTGRNIPFISEYRGATLILLFLGFLMCTFGAMGYVFTKHLLSPFTLAGAILGVLALGVGILTFFNKTVPFINNDREAFLTIAVIIFLKVILTRIHLWVLR